MEAPTQASRDAGMGPLSPSMSSNERRKILRSLFLTLSPYELREFRRWIDQVDFRCDLITKFPLEITHQILGYLPLHKSFRFRRVSKAWFRILCAPQTVRHLLQFWYPEAEAKLDVPEGLKSSAVSSSIAEHVDAYRSGSAFSMVRRIWSPTDRPSSTAKVVYANGYVAWTSIGHKVLSYHLESGSYQRWQPPEEEGFRKVAISSSVLVATTNKRMCHVMAHADNHRLIFPLASKSVKKITASGDTVGILYDWSREDDMQIGVTIWTLKTKKSVQCRAKLHSPPFGQASHDDIKIMIGANLDYLVLFERCVSLRSFYFTRFSLDGQLHSQGSLEGPDTATFSKHSESLVPSDVGGCSTVWSYSHKQEGGKRDRLCTKLIRVQYYSQQNQLRLEADCIPWSYPMKSSNFSIWKDVFYYREYDSHLKICNLSNREVSNAATMRRYVDQAKMRACHEIFSDEKFMVNVCDKGFLAWCFNKDSEMNGADETYPHHRQNETRKRRKSHQEWETWRLECAQQDEEIDLDITGSVGNYRTLQENQK